jgi:RNA polymerase sigma factor (sigma-70 family)
MKTVTTAVAAVETAVAEAAATTDDSHSSLALVGADRGERSAPARAGDTKAVGNEVGRLFAEHSRLVFALCNVLLCDREEAEDATQQCFLSAQKSMLAGTVPADAAAWLAAIARNECLSRLRRRRPATVALRDDDLVTDADVADLVDRRTEIAALSEAIAGLPPAQRQAVILRDFYGLSYREVSVALGVTGPAVESLLFKSRKRLQKRLRPFHAASGIAAVPAAIRDALGRAIPGFSSGLQTHTTGAGLAAKLLSGHAAAKLAALGLVAGLGTMALTHEPAALFQRASKPTPLASAPRRVALAPDVALAAPVTRPPDAIASPLRVTHVARPAPKPPAPHKVVIPTPQVVVTPPTPAPSVPHVPKTVAGATTKKAPFTPPIVLPHVSETVPTTTPRVTPVRQTPTIPVAPAETTPRPVESPDDGGSGGSSTFVPTTSSTTPVPTGATPTDTGQGSSGTSGGTSSGSDDVPSQSSSGSDGGQVTTVATTTTPTTTTTTTGDSGRHRDGDHGSTSESESDGGHTTTTATTTTTTATTTTPTTTATTTATTTTTTTDG